MDKTEMYQQLKNENEDLRERLQEFQDRLNAGRHYLMGVNASDITVEDTLEAFGWKRNGLDRQ